MGKAHAVQFTFYKRIYFKFLVVEKRRLTAVRHSKMTSRDPALMSPEEREQYFQEAEETLKDRFDHFWQNAVGVQQVKSKVAWITDSVSRSAECAFNMTPIVGIFAMFYMLQSERFSSFALSSRPAR